MTKRLIYLQKRGKVAPLGGRLGFSELSSGSFTSRGDEKLQNLCESFSRHVCNLSLPFSHLQLPLFPLTFPNKLSWKFVRCQAACLRRWKCLSVYLELSEHFCGSLPNLIWTKLLPKQWMNNSLWAASLTPPPLFSDPVTLPLPTGALEVFSLFFWNEKTAALRCSSSRLRWIYDVLSTCKGKERCERMLNMFSYLPP